MKTCTKCGEKKPVTDFYRDRQKSDGFGSHCRLCRKEIYRPNRQKYYRDNREKILDSGKKWRKENPEQYRGTLGEYRKNHPEKYTANAAKRRANQKNATPNWLTKDQSNDILRFYELARKLTEESGIVHEVDHIVPLQNKTVCGLHVPWNLQVLTLEENRSKGNKHEN